MNGLNDDDYNKFLPQIITLYFIVILIIEKPKKEKTKPAREKSFRLFVVKDLKRYKIALS